MKLRGYQVESIAHTRQALQSGSKRVVLGLATGAGKTVIAATIIQRALDKGKRVWFLCDNMELVEQSVETFERFGMDVGVIQGQHEKTNYSKMLQVATPQTLTRRWVRFDMNNHWLPDLIIVDECHVVYKGHRELFRMMPDTPAIGLSATPYTKGLGELYQKLVPGATTSELVDLGFLSNSIVYSANIPSLKSVKSKSNGDWQEESLAKEYNNKKITGDIVSTWKKLAEHRQSIVFCINVQHSIDVAQAFNDAGVKTGHIDGYTDKELRKDIISDYKSGEITILCNVGVLTKGFDAPETSCIVLARPTKSKMLHYQILGRGLRTAHGKDDCIILDHAGNVKRIGFPEDNIPTSLCDGTNGNKKDRVDAPVITKKCPKCGQELKITQKMCPCGHEFEFQKKLAEVDVEPGELKLLSPTQRKNIKNSDGKSQQAFYSGMLGYAKYKEYNSHYADYKFKERYGVFPTGFKRIEGDYKSGEVAKYITYLNIKNSYAEKRR